MKSEYLTAIAIAPFAATVGLAVYVVSSSEPDFCPQPSAASVTSLFAPCQTFDTAMGHAVTKREAVRMGLLRPEEQPASPDTHTQLAARLASRLAESVDRFLQHSGG